MYYWLLGVEKFVWRKDWRSKRAAYTRPGWNGDVRAVDRTLELRSRIIDVPCVRVLGQRYTIRRVCERIRAALQVDAWSAPQYDVCSVADGLIFVDCAFDNLLL